MDVKSFRDIFRQVLGSGFESDGGFVVAYGSRAPGRDMDLLVVQNQVAPFPSVVVGRLDLIVMERGAFRGLLTKFDPLAMEPVLTGEVILGDEADWIQLRHTTEGAAAGKEVIEHLSRRCIEEFDAGWQVLHWPGGGSEIQILRWSVQNLAFAVSYRSLARHYQENVGGPVPIAQLIASERAWAPEFWRFRKRIKDDECVRREEVESWFSRFVAKESMARDERETPLATIPARR